MTTALLIPFPGSGPTTLAEVGGKGMSLIRLIDAGLPVPPGAVLTTPFFAPWFDEIRASSTWADLVDAPPEERSRLCPRLKALCPSLGLTATQSQALEDLHESLTSGGDGGLLAVRSSSPEEDLASASFAGIYETLLGVYPADLVDALRDCLASSLDERVLAYKEHRGLDVRSPRLAVIVQQQIDSEVAGVAFSLNPLTNDHDEAVIDANWGLGESVVAGLVSPDHFVVDKIGRQIVERKLGAKQLSIWLGPEGGTIQRTGHRSAECTLGEARLAELTDVICRVEELDQRPMDIEWAYAGGRLHVLQARPITTYVPLPPEMMTEPGERRRLYADVSLSSGLTINTPISPMGLDWMEQMYSGMIESVVGPSSHDVSPKRGLVFYAGGRMYQNLSNTMRLASPGTLAKGSAANDALMADILSNIDADRYRATGRPHWLGWRLAWLVPRGAWGLRGFLWNTLWAILAPTRAHRAHQRRVDALESGLARDLDGSPNLAELRRFCASRAVRQLWSVDMSALTAGLYGLAMVDRVVGRKSAETQALAEKLKVGFTGNVVVEMGIALFRLAGRLDRTDFHDLDALSERIAKRRMPPGFLRAWDAFLSTYGSRGPGEMDLASPRYADDPRLALRQMASMPVDDERYDPGAAHGRCVKERHRAFATLMVRLGWLRRARLRRIHRIIDLFAGARDSPKHHVLMAYHAVRRRVLIEGRHLVLEGRLDAAEHVFDLTFGDLESAGQDPSLDLREIRDERTRFLKKLDAHVREFPPVIDSRGRILRPAPRDERPGELTGMAVSPGIVTGPVKVLHNPHEKSVDKGDVLVAYTTDPGWTPLFVNASAVVLEVGGVLQHGAVVAREYGKPCVTGIDRVMSRLHDGQMVEVDGGRGVIRMVTA